MKTLTTTILLLFTLTACGDQVVEAVPAEVVDTPPAPAPEPAPLPPEPSKVDSWVTKAEAFAADAATNGGVCSRAASEILSDELVKIEQDKLLKDLPIERRDHILGLHDTILDCGLAEWTYTNDEDPMGGPTRYFAAARSTNAFDLKFPYDGPQRGALLLRDDGKSVDALLSINKGQFMCTLGCSVEVRFDEEDSVTWRADDPASMDSTLIFLRQGPKFVKAISKAKTVKIKITLYDQAPVILNFIGGVNADLKPTP